MVDEPQNPDLPQDEADDDDDISWEDAFQEAAAGHQAEAEAEASGEPSMSAEAMIAQEQAEAKGVDIDFLLDISLDVTVEVGRTKMLVNDLLQLQQGSVIDLEKMVGEPFELYVNGKLMAYGEVVVVNEKFGVRLTDVIDPRERIQQLG